MSVLLYFLLLAVDAWTADPKQKQEAIIRSENTVEETKGMENTVLSGQSWVNPGWTTPTESDKTVLTKGTEKTIPLPQTESEEQVRHEIIGLCVVVAVCGASFLGWRYRPDAKATRSRTNAEYLVAGYQTAESSASQPFLEEEVSVGQLSVTAAVFSLITTMVGAGILAFPSITRACGWYFTPFVILGAGCVSLGTCKMLAELIERVPGDCSQYKDVVAKCLGERGGLLAEVCITGLCFGITAILLVLIGENLDFLFPWSARGWVIVTGAVMACTALLRDISVLAKLSAIGVLASVMYVVCICGGAISAARSYDENLRPHASHWPDGGLTIVTNFAVSLFGFACTHMLPAFRKDLANPEDLGKTAAISHAVVMSVYLVVGMIGYYGWGDAASSMILMSMCGNPGCEGSPNLAGTSKATISALEAGARTEWGFILAGAVVANLVVTLPLVNYVLFQGLEARVPALKSAGLASSSARIGCVLIATVIAVFTPYFKELLAILSTSMLVCIQILLPAASCFQLDRTEGRTRYDALLFLLIGLVVVVVGMYGACSDFASALRQGGDEHGFWHSKWVKPA